MSAKGDTKASVILEGGIQADLRVVSDAEYPFALAYFTGSKEHNIVMRQRAIQRGLRLNEYGLFRSTEETRDPALRVSVPDRGGHLRRARACAPSRRSCARTTGSSPPAEQGALPRLIEWTDLRGSLHNHSNWSDGRDTLEEIAAHMEDLGLRLLGDHGSLASRRSRRTGSTRRACASRSRRSEQVNGKLADEGSDFRLLTGTEVDILRRPARFRRRPARGTRRGGRQPARPGQRRGREHQAPDPRGGEPVRPHARPSDRTAAARTRAVQGQLSRRSSTPAPRPAPGSS